MVRLRMASPGRARSLARDGDHRRLDHVDHLGPRGVQQMQGMVPQRLLAVHHLEDARGVPAELSRAPLVGQQVDYLLSRAQLAQPVGDHRLDRAGGGGHVPDRIIAGLRDQSALVQPGQGAADVAGRQPRGRPDLRSGGGHGRGHEAVDAVLSLGGSQCSQHLSPVPSDRQSLSSGKSATIPDESIPRIGRAG
jgi:hypothetical protein